MKTFQRVMCIALIFIMMLPVFTGCSKKKTDDTIYLTKGEFFAYFVYENGMTSDKYTAEEIQSCSDGSVEADIIVEWGYLPEKLAKKNLSAPVQKEIVVMVCANATFDLKQGKTADIKDADLLEDPQLIADAYASDFFELENGYFDGAQKMSFADCEAVMNQANYYTANLHYAANTEITETAEGVKEQNSENYQEGDIVIQIIESDSGTETASEDAATNVSYPSKDNDEPKVSLLGHYAATDKQESYESDRNAVQLYNSTNQFGFQNIKGFTASIAMHVFEKDLGNPEIGDTVILNRFQVLMSNTMNRYGTGEVVGVLTSKQKIGSTYSCTFDYPQFEQAVEKKNVKEANGSGIDTKSFDILEETVAGWKLDFDVSSGAVKISAEKDFTVYETGRKQDWQNAKKTITASANFEMSDFNLDVKNLKAFANKKGKGFIKVTCDSEFDFSLSQSLRYTPDSNRNGKFPSNWKNSRWTDSDSKGAKSIKVARFSPSLYGVATIDVYIYLQISFDGKISFTTSIADGGVEISVNNGKISKTKLGKKDIEFSANANVYGRLGVEAGLKIFGFINVITYDVGLDANANAFVNLYYEEKMSKANVCADEEGLEEYRADDGKFSYCIGATLELGVSGKMKDSGVKMILNWISKGESLDFSFKVWKGGLHFENGSFVDECTRGKESEEKALKESESDEIELGSYKVNLYVGDSDCVSVMAVPAETLNLVESKNAITVKSLNADVCTVTYNKSSRTIIIEAKGEGSTEIVINGKKEALWWKETCEQKISVTVNAAKSIEPTGVSISEQDDVAAMTENSGYYQMLCWYPGIIVPTGKVVEV